MRKKILIINPEDILCTNDAYYYDEYLYNLIGEKKINQKKFFFSLEYLKKIKNNNKKIFKKLNRYRKELSKTLNKIHKKDLDETSWGIILDKYLFQLVSPIVTETKNFKKIKTKEKNFLIFEEKFDKKYSNTREFVSEYYNDNRFAYIRYLIAKNLGFKIIKRKKHKKNIKKKDYHKESIMVTFSRNIINFYVKILKPSLIVNSYLGASNAIKIFFQSFGKILILPSKYFFNYSLTIPKKNFKIRETFKVVEKDFVDKIFNLTLKDLTPISYLENFKNYDEITNKMPIPQLLGSGISLIADDFFKFLSVKVLKEKKKVISFQHGFNGKERNKNKIFDYIFQKKYSSEYFSWYDKKAIKENFFDKYEKFKTNHRKQKNILIYPTSNLDRTNYSKNLTKKYHPFLNNNFKFYDNLDEEVKLNVRIKLFPLKEKLTTQIWLKKYGNKNLFVKNQKNIFNKFKIVVIDDVSTPLCELLYTGTPFILIDNELEFLSLNVKKKIKDLKKINIFFNDPKKASNFLNKNFNNLSYWWNNVKKSKSYISLKKELLPTTSNVISLNKKIQQISLNE